MNPAVTSMGSVATRDASELAPVGDYDPSSWKKRVSISFLAALALLIATYMALYQWGLLRSVWDPVFGQGSQRVLTSKLSHQIQTWVRVPDAALGAVAYLGDIVLGMAGSVRRWQTRPWLVMAFGLNVIPLGIVSAILVGLQGLIVGSWCFLCLMTATISLVLAGLASREIGACARFLWRVWAREHNAGLLWNTFWGRPSPVAHAVARDIAERSA